MMSEIYKQHATKLNDKAEELTAEWFAGTGIYYEWEIRNYPAIFKDAWIKKYHEIKLMLMEGKI
jgi:hypothetical protein